MNVNPFNSVSKKSDMEGWYLHFVLICTETSNKNKFPLYLLALVVQDELI